MRHFWRTYLFPFVYALCIYASLRLVNDVISDTRFWLRPLWLNITEVAVSTLACYIAAYTIGRLLRYQQQRPQPMSIAKEYGLAALLLTAISYTLIIPMAALTDDGLQWYDVVNITLIPLLYWLLYYAVQRASDSIKKNDEQQLLLEKISKDQLQTALRFLKAQFHPHFLFNALNTVYFQMDEDVSAAKHTVEKLSELLRYQLYDQQQTVPVGHELQYLQSFIELQQSRMNEHLNLQVDFDPQLNKQNVYPLLLLPLVENAFKYAGGSYWINIAARLEDDRLAFHVSNAIPAEIPTRKQGGIGLENLRRRLALLYPGKHELHTGTNGDHYTADLKITL